MSERTRNSKIIMLTESALMLAAAMALNEFTPFKLPFGGSVTLFSQVPIILIAYRYRTKWGLVTSFLMGALQFLFGFFKHGFPARTLSAILIFILCDYVLAYGVLGLGGIFRDKLKQKQYWELALGGLFVSLLRYALHIVSGVTIYRDMSAGFLESLVFSISYNGSYMVPELIITVVGLFIIGSLLDFRQPKLRPLRRHSK